MKRDVVIAVLLMIAGIILAGCPVRRGSFLEGREFTGGQAPTAAMIAVTLALAAGPDGARPAVATRALQRA